MRIEFDFRFDTNGFFDDPERRAALEAAGDIWEEILLDDFAAVPAGIEFSAIDPQTGESTPVVLETAIDDLVIFVGAQSLAESNIIAVGGFTGTDAQGDFFSARISSNFRGQGAVTNFEPWAGTIAFDPDVDFSFSIDNPEPGQVDFISVALHEIGHVLGIGTAPIFLEIGLGAQFDGPNALAVNQGSPVPLEADLVHVQDGFNNNTVLLDPIINPIALSGGRNFPSDVDLALLADIGYEIDGFVTQGSTPAIATDASEIIFGTVVADQISALAGDDQIQGNAGDDELFGGTGDDLFFGGAGDDELFGDAGNDQIQGGFGSDRLAGGAGNDSLFGETASDTFVFAPNDGEDTVGDFVVGEDTIEVAADFGFADGAAVLEAIDLTGTATSGGLFAQLPLGPETTVTIFHDEALTAADFAIAASEPVVPNVAPTFTSPATVDVLEDTTAVLTLAADDPEEDVLSFSIVGGADQAAFILDPLTGELTFQTAPDFEAPSDADGDNIFAVEVAVTDGTNGPALQALTVTLTDDPTDNPDTPAPEIPDDPIDAPDTPAPAAPAAPINLNVDGSEELEASVDILNIFRVLAGAPQAVAIPAGVSASQQDVVNAVESFPDLGLDVDGSGDVVASVDVLNIFRVLAGAPQAVAIPVGVAASQQDVVDAVNDLLA